MQPLHLNYPNHMQSVERAVNMTTTASGRIACSERQIGEALCSIAGRKNQWSVELWKNIFLLLLGVQVRFGFT